MIVGVDLSKEEATGQAGRLSRYDSDFVATLMHNLLYRNLIDLYFHSATEAESSKGSCFYLEKSMVNKEVERLTSLSKDVVNFYSDHCILNFLIA